MSTITDDCLTRLEVVCQQMIEQNRALKASNAELVNALQLCYDHCRLYHKEVEINNVGIAVREAITKAKERK